MDARSLIEKNKPVQSLRDARNQITRMSDTKQNGTTPRNTISSRITVKPRTSSLIMPKKTVTVKNSSKTKFTTNSAVYPAKRTSSHYIDDVLMKNNPPARSLTVVSMEANPKNLSISINSHRNVQSGQNSDNQDQNEQKINRQIENLLKSYGHVDFSQQYSLSEREEFEYKSPLCGVKVCVKNLPEIIAVDNLYHIFSAFGAVRLATMSKSSAEIVFSTMEEALAVKKRYHHRTFHDCTLDVSLEEDSRQIADCEEKYDYPTSTNRKDENPIPSYGMIMSFISNGGISARAVSFTVYL